MTFIRTSSGLSNQHLFHDVDFIVFVEGGKSFTKEEINKGLFNEESIDVLFWSKIIQKYKQHSKVKFKAIGSKTAVIKVAEDIIANSLTTVYAAMDQEFDRVLGTAYKHDNILYTFGYSWENDVWNENVILDIIKSTTAKDIDKKNVIESFDKFLREIKYSVYVDGYLFNKRNSFFPRPNGHLRLVECDVRRIPVLKKNEIEILLTTIGLNKSTVYSFGCRKKLQSKHYCYGHLINDFCKKLIQHVVVSKHKVIGLGDEVIRRMAIGCFTKNMDEAVSNHYKLTIK